MKMILNRKHLSIRRNKQRGGHREKKALKWLKSRGFAVLETKSSYHSFDFFVENGGHKLLIEHKSCLDRIYSGNRKIPMRVVNGRFKIIVENHEEMPRLAEEFLAEAKYLFQVVDANGESRFFFKNWEDIDNIMGRNSRFYFLSIGRLDENFG